VAASTKYGFRQLEELWAAAGGAQKDAPLMASIALAESGGSPTAHNPSGATGLWQILLPVNANYVPGGAANATNPLANAKAAVAILRSQGPKAWETYTSGAYKRYLPSGGESLISTAAKFLTGGLETVVGIQSGNASLLKGVSVESKVASEGLEAADEAAGGFLQTSAGELVLKGVLLLAGAILVIYGIMVAVRPPDRALSLPRMPAMLPVPV
jgi:Lysozyme like domain